MGKGGVAEKRATLDLVIEQSCEKKQRSANRAEMRLCTASRFTARPGNSMELIPNQLPSSSAARRGSSLPHQVDVCKQEQCLGVVQVVAQAAAVGKQVLGCLCCLHQATHRQTSGKSGRNRTVGEMTLPTEVIL